MNYFHLGNVVGLDRNVPINVKKGQTLSFFDDKYLGYTSSLERILYFPKKLLHPVMTATKPWERFGKYECVGGFSGKCIVAKDNKLMMFYSIYHMDGNREFRSFAYAESRDGITWIKPAINKQRTNIIVKNDGSWPYYELQNVIWDEHSSQYLGLGHCKVSEKRWGTFVASTTDPLHWEQKNFRWLYKNTDIHALMGWDEDKKAYVSYIRVPIYQNGIQKRAIGISLSKDFKTWTDPVLVLAPWINSIHQIYNMPVTKMGGYYFGFPVNYYPQNRHLGPLESGLVLSGDGITWKNFHPAYIPRGLPGEWDDCYTMVAAPVEWQGNLLFYYWGCNFPHDEGFKEERENKGSVGLAVVPKHGMLSLACARYNPGTLSIVPIYVQEKCKIVVTAETSRGSLSAYDGFTKLAIVPKNGREYYLEREGGWEPNKEINLKLYLSDCEVFAISFE
jgi:hypothetical protein